MFSETDLLVLLYVAARSEIEADSDSIQTELEQGAHQTVEFCERLYPHTPLLQEPPDGLDETWNHGFLLCGAGGQRFLELARNYRHVAERLLETALESGCPVDHSYPVLFAYRHALELYLKLVGEIEEATHSLQRCLHLVEKRHGQKLREPVRGWILELDRIDREGTAFRYAGVESEPLKFGEYWLDLHHLKFAMRQTFEALDRAILHLGIEGKPVKKRRKKQSLTGQGG